ncbi:hypothetical protein BDZ94DRAFT_1177124 [Collybia nuda]|uniref:DUF659 domain-containing protein n=1 Tax=Collybia nuda TaxID=64659 RepID=A0A9P5XTT5_9AGAR|nr:hypothetical protein BDZ94DRAFT_1177124 [Collybia nuda]
MARIDDWTPFKQSHFERKIARVTASGGLPLSWVENLEVQSFFEEFVPGANLPSRSTLTRRLIPEAAAEFRVATISSSKGKNVTLQGDGWTGENKLHLEAFMISIDGKLQTVRVHDATNERKNTENLLQVLEEILMTLQNEWGVIVVALVTDASGESRKARRLFGLKYPWIIVLDCYAHQVGDIIIAFSLTLLTPDQINLVVGDYFKSDAPVLDYTDEATELITWLRSRTIVLGLIRQAQIDTVGPSHTKAVIRAVLTRWTSHYMAFN